MLLLENVKLALSSIKMNKMRSFLTMLGIIIGISSVIAITSIGASAEAVVNKEFQSFGTNAMYLYMNWEMTADSGIQYSDLILPEDIDALKARFPEDILYVCPSLYGSSEVIGRESQWQAGNGRRGRRLQQILPHGYGLRQNDKRERHPGKERTHSHRRKSFPPLFQ